MKVGSETEGKAERRGKSEGEGVPGDVVIWWHLGGSLSLLWSL